MKIAWFYYKEDSILDNGFVRWLNYAMLGILAVGPFLNQEFKGVFLTLQPNCNNCHFANNNRVLCRCC